MAEFVFTIKYNQMKENLYSKMTVKELKNNISLCKALALVTTLVTILMLLYYFYKTTFGNGTSMSIGLPIFTGVLVFVCIKIQNTIEAELNKREHQ